MGRGGKGNRSFTLRFCRRGRGACQVGKAHYHTETNVKAQLGIALIDLAEREEKRTKYRIHNHIILLQPIPQLVHIIKHGYTQILALYE